MIMAFKDTNMNPTVNTHRANGIKGANNGFNPGSPDANGLVQTSTNIFIYANDGVIGMIQSFSVSESRNINKLQAIGYEGVVQAVPSNTNGGQLSVTRMALYGSNIYRALGLTTNGHNGSPVGHKVNAGIKDDTSDKNDSAPAMSAIGDGSSSANYVFRTLRDQRVPLEIKIKTKMSGTGSEPSFYEERYVDCWLSSFSKSFTVSQITVAENATIQYGDLY